MKVGVQDGEDDVGDDTDGVGGRVKLVHETLIPGVDAVLEDLLDQVHEAILARGLGREVELESGDEISRLHVVKEDILCLAVRVDVGLSGVLLRSGIIGSLDEGDDELADGAEKLR